MTAATIDRTKVMNEAWAYVREEMARTRYSIGLMRYALRMAWADAKARALGLKAVGDLSPAETELAALQNKRHQTREDFDRMDALRAEIQHQEAAEEYAAKRQLIASAPEASVTFTKADGTERTMRVNAMGDRVKGHRASDAGQRAAITRKLRHPHLLPVWDADKAAARSVNLATVKAITVAGATHTYQ